MQDKLLSLFKISFKVPKLLEMFCILGIWKYKCNFRDPFHEIEKEIEANIDNNLAWILRY